MQTKSKAGSYAKRAIKYATDVLSGRILACQLVHLSCQRFLNDIESEQWTYDHAKANHVCEFAENSPHIKGEWAGTTIKLEGWQCFILCNLFGVVSTKTKLRKYREAYVCVPRKNAKSTIGGVVGNYMAWADGEAGAEVYSGATTQKQAMAVYTTSKRMVELSPDMQDAFGITVMAQSMYDASGSYFQTVCGDPGEGQSPHCWILDEYHEADHDKQYSSAKTGRGARRQPISPLVITTAGINLAGPCRDLQTHAEEVLHGLVENDPLFALVYTIDPGDDWKDWNSWVKANPNFGVSVGEEYLRGQYNEAINRPSARSEMRTKHLNEWVSSAESWIDQVAWAKSVDSAISYDGLKGHTAYLALDLARRTDLVAIIAVVPLPPLPPAKGAKASTEPRYATFSWFFAPQAALEGKNRPAYEQWSDDGDLILTPDDATDYGEVEAKVLEIAEHFSVASLVVDPHQAEYMRQRLADTGVSTVEFTQRVANYTPIATDFEADLRNNRIIHDDNPVMNWCAHNICAQTLNDGRAIKLQKPRGQEHLKIDGIMALLMAYGEAKKAPAPKRSAIRMWVLN